ncbi:MAG: 2-dehydro-3-deoxygalactonokinase, partial [Lentilitoribacter sp.]
IWIAVDWGTSNLRVWLMSDGNILAMKSSPQGMSGLAQVEYEPVLMELISQWLDKYSKGSVIQIMACGMVGSQQGWKEAGYTSIPCSPSNVDFTKPRVEDARIDVSILAGLSQLEPADVMRGEETQIAGFFAKNADFSGLICMPGTHSKWAYLENGEVVRFKTVMTGEMYSIICDHSVLRQLVNKNASDTNAFQKGVLEGAENPELLLSNLFSIRARSVLENENSNASAAHLSGILIGTEIATMKKQMPSDTIKLLGSGVLAELYAQAFAVLGQSITPMDVTELTVLGLHKAWQNLTKEKYLNVS